MNECKICGADTEDKRICQDCEKAINQKVSEIKVIWRARK